MSSEELAGLTRDELNAKAEQLGVPNPASLPNKQAVLAAIRAAQPQGGPAEGDRSAHARRARLLRQRRAKGQL